MPITAVTDIPDESQSAEVTEPTEARATSTDPAEVGTRERAGWPAELQLDLLSGKWNLGFVLRDLHRSFRMNVKKRMAELNLPVGIWGYLWALYYENGLTQKELAKRIRLVGPSVVFGLNQLEKLGLVKRQRSVQDKRVVHIHLTPKADALRDEIFAAAAETNAKALRYLTSNEINLLFSLLDRVGAGIHGDVGGEAADDDDPS
ncbi:MarR family winged helix-turn-helix transcriptional regulator [Paraburkholderia sediminicola]|uniref:MarR family winged helix-turn-helix transcriptional regulator n=1 Tax=Paraburkholderia sediminicola TaxID=458836 RepID=UPI0038BB1F10